jgi:hypothetical protein
MVEEVVYHLSEEPAIGKRGRPSAERKTVASFWPRNELICAGQARRVGSSAPSDRTRR